MEARCVLILFGVLVFAGSGYAQCSQTQNITVGGGITDTAMVNTTIVPTCIICLTMGGMPAGGIVTFSLNTNVLAAMDGIAISNNLLIVSNFSSFSIIDGVPNAFECVDGATGGRTTRVLTTLNPILPSFQLQPGAFIVEFDDLRVVCVNRNALPFEGDTLWLDPMGLPVGSGGVLELDNISRSRAGLYACYVVLTDQTVMVEIPTLFFTILVHYPPDVNTINATEFFDLNSTLNVSCTFDGIPSPLLVWLHDEVEVSSANDSITITTTNATSGISVLEWVNVPRSAFGTLACVFSNNLGMRNASISIRIRTPPEPATGLEARNITETTIEVFWTKQGDGLSPILGGDLEFFIVGSSDPTATEMIREANVSSFVIIGLTPFAFYNISLVVVNRIGPSEPVSIVNQTLSLFLEAPAVTLNAQSSTEMLVSWIPPTTLNTTEGTFFWTIEFSRMDGSDSRVDFVEESIRNFQFVGLAKGTQHMVRVAGNNTRGLGAFSPFVVTRTDIDPPSAPINITAEGLSSFAINSTWLLPDDNGGSPVISYQVNITEEGIEVILSESVGLSAEPSFFVNNMTTIKPSQEYLVSVRAQNVMGFGPAANASVTTRNISEPQPVLEQLVVSTISNISSTLMWNDPGGDVISFIIMYVVRVDPMMAFNVTLNGNETSITLMNLEPSTTYAVTIITVNNLGQSMASPLALIETLPAPFPVITVSPEGPFEVGDVLVLTCTSPHNKVIQWTKRDGSSLDPPAFVQMEGALRSTLTLSEAREADSGIYECRVGEISSNITITINVPPTVATKGQGISTTVIIIAAGLGGGLGVVILLIIIFIIVICCIKNNKKPASFDLKPTKRGKELFDVSNNFTPTTNTGITRGTDVSFNLPSDYQSHSSFNTLEKNLARSHSPETMNPSSFGGGLNRESTDCLVEDNRYGMYQDEVPPPSNGAML